MVSGSRHRVDNIKMSFSSSHFSNNTEFHSKTKIRSLFMVRCSRVNTQLCIVLEYKINIFLPRIIVRRDYGHLQIRQFAKRVEARW